MFDIFAQEGPSISGGRYFLTTLFCILHVFNSICNNNMITVVINQSN